MKLKNLSKYSPLLTCINFKFSSTFALVVSELCPQAPDEGVSQSTVLVQIEDVLYKQIYPILLEPEEGLVSFFLIHQILFNLGDRYGL